MSLYLLNPQEKKIEILKNKLESIRVKPIVGSLYIKRGRSFSEFYHQTYVDGKIYRKYISRKDIALARRLAQQSYNRSVGALLSSMKGKEMRIEEIDRAIDDLLLTLCPERRGLITPVQPTLEEKLAEWKNRSYRGRSFRQDDPLIYTNNHERVRSKTEKIIADALEKAGVTYKYEAPLLMEDGATVYPDFTFFDPSPGPDPLLILHLLLHAHGHHLGLGARLAGGFHLHDDDGLPVGELFQAASHGDRLIHGHRAEEVDLQVGGDKAADDRFRSQVQALVLVGKPGG